MLFSELSEEAVKHDDGLCLTLVQLVCRSVGRDLLISFIRCFLLDSNSTAVRWQAHTLVLHIYRSGWVGAVWVMLIWVRSGQVRSGQVRSVWVGAVWVRSVWVRSGQVRSGQVRSGQSGSGQSGSGQAGLGQVSPG